MTKPIDQGRHFLKVTAKMYYYFKKIIANVTDNFTLVFPGHVDFLDLDDSYFDLFTSVLATSIKRTLGTW